MGAELHFCSPSELGNVSRIGRAEVPWEEVWLSPGALTIPWTAVSWCSLGPLLHPALAPPAILGNPSLSPGPKLVVLAPLVPPRQLLMMSLLQ